MVIDEGRLVYCFFWSDGEQVVAPPDYFLVATKYWIELKTKTGKTVESYNLKHIRTIYWKI